MRVTPLFCLLVATALPGFPAIAANQSPAATMLPERVLECVLGRATNIDPSKNQTTADIVYEGHHALKLRLPAIAMRQGPPPDPSDKPEPVDPRTRILADPDHLLAESAPNFDRVVDLWPQRVEMTARAQGTASNGMPLSRLFVIDPINEGNGTASLFLTTAADAASIDINAIYQGPCKVTMSHQQAAR